MKAQKMDDGNIIEQLRHLGKSGERNDSKERHINSFHHIKELKETTDKQDHFNIYKLNCRDINGEPNFVFKTSSKTLELAVKRIKTSPKVKEAFSHLNMHLWMPCITE